MSALTRPLTKAISGVLVFRFYSFKSCRDHRFTRTQWDQKVSADEKAPDLEDPKGSLC